LVGMRAGSNRGLVENDIARLALALVCVRRRENRVGR
jgi:hypothetical protein